MAAKAQAKSNGLPLLAIKQMEVRIVGDSPLICHKWSEKAKEMMLDKQMKRAKLAATPGITALPVCPDCGRMKAPVQFYDERCYGCAGKAAAPAVWGESERRVHAERRELPRPMIERRRP